MEPGPPIVTPRVWPSVALAVASAPMVPPPPARLSMTKGWPKTWLKCCETARAAMSGVEPPGKLTTTRTGRSGQAGWAMAGRGAVARAGSARRARRVADMTILRRWTDLGLKGAV